MIRFLLKGILNDKSRSLLPVIVISIGAALTVVLYCWIKGIMGESVVMTANFDTGHVKVMTRAYAKEAGQMPNDLSIIGTDTLLRKLRSEYSELQWVERIRFGGLIDFPDENNETRAQGPAAGWAIDMFGKGSKEKERFNIQSAIVRGAVPRQAGEALISDEFARKFNVRPGDRFTLFSSTIDGAMAFKNFIVSGTVRFGSPALDRGAVIIDLNDARLAFNMENAAGEILGYFNDGIYKDNEALPAAARFNAGFRSSSDEFAPVMIALRDQNGLGEYIDYMNATGTFMVFIFVIAMSVVLWNTGLLGGLRRYSEFGLRLALGEEKKHIYKTLLYESVLIGLIGSVAGTAIGTAVSYYLQENGIDLSGFFQNSSLMIPSVVRPEVTSAAFYIGFIPGLFSMVLGNALAGMGIYKRETAQLFKELEV